MQTDFSPTSSEVLVFIGAGATSALGMPSTDDQTDILRKLSEAQKSDGAEFEEAQKTLQKYFSEKDLRKINAFLKLLDGTNESNFIISDEDLESARVVFGNSAGKELLQKRILELRSDYDWNALKKVIKSCPYNKDDDNLIRDAYSIIDHRILSRQSLKISLGHESGLNEEILSPSRLKGARNFLTLFISMLFAGSWNNITDGSKSDEFNLYKNFISAFDRLMQNEGMQFYQQKKSVNSRDFYLFSTSFVSFNFEMVFPWIFMNSHRELNHRPPYIQDHPLKLWLDYGVEHRGRKIVGDKIEPTLEFTESVASRENEDEHIGTPLNRAGKFYFAHGSSAWRECPVCGRMTFYNGNNHWEYKSKSLIPRFPIPLFDADKTESKEFTLQENEWRKKLKYDSLQCMHCGAETKALDAPMIMQSLYKSTPTSFLEEIQRNVKLSLRKARHIILFGYQLPPDDTIWRHAFAEAICSRKDNDDAAYCSIVVGHKGEQRWLYGDELLTYVNAHRKDDDATSWGGLAIQNAIAIFGDKNVRAYTGGIPQVFGNGTEADVRELFYPKTEWIKWNGTRIEGI